MDSKFSNLFHCLADPVAHLLDRVNGVGVKRRGHVCALKVCISVEWGCIYV